MPCDWLVRQGKIPSKKQDAEARKCSCCRNRLNGVAETSHIGNHFVPCPKDVLSRRCVFFFFFSRRVYHFKYGLFFFSLFSFIAHLAKERKKKRLVWNKLPPSCCVTERGGLAGVFFSPPM